MKKRITALLMALVLLAMCIPANAVYESKKSKDGLWTYDWYSQTILSYHGDAENLKIPESIDGYYMTKVGYHAIAHCTSLKTVELSNCIDTIQANAFEGCTNLKTVKAQENISIGTEAFKDCVSLESLKLVEDPKGEKKEIGTRAFENCVSLKELPSLTNYSKLNDQAFKGCTGLRTVQLPKNLILGDGVFAGCTKLDGIWAHPNSSAMCNDEYGVLFSKDKTELLAAPGGLLGTYVVPDTVKKISRYAFWGCNKLEVVIVPDSVTYMGLETFQYCTSLHTAVLSRNTTYGQFKGCTALDVVVIDRMVDDGTFTDCTGLKSIYNPGAKTDHDPRAFTNVTANMYYVESKSKLSLQELQPYQYGGEITWVPLEGYCVAKGDGSTYSVGSDIGAIFLVMATWDKFLSVTVDGKKLAQDQYLSLAHGTAMILKDEYLQTLSLGTHKLKVFYSDGSCDATFTLTDAPVCRHEVIYKEAKDPTCTKAGNTEGSYCGKCDKVFEQWKEIPKLGHDYKVTTVEPTCTEAGYDLHTCTRCADTKRDGEIPALGHDLACTTVPPACTQGGYDEYMCTRCDYSMKNNETAPEGHTFGQWETIRQPTTENHGLEARKCLKCGVKQEQLMDKLTPPPTEPPVHTEPTQPPTTAPAATEPAPTQPDHQGGGEPANLVPMIILGAVLLVAAAVGMMYLFRKRS